MKTRNTLFTLACTAIAASAVYYIVKGFKQARQTSHVAHEGYETAHDVLYPKKESRSKKIHLGPVLPTE